VAAAHWGLASGARVEEVRGWRRLIKAWGPGLGVWAKGTARAEVGLGSGDAWPSPAQTRLVGGDDERAPAVSDRGRGSGGGAGWRQWAGWARNASWAGRRFARAGGANGLKGQAGRGRSWATAAAGCWAGVAACAGWAAARATAAGLLGRIE
jgi:hypothetical protein